MSVRHSFHSWHKRPQINPYLWNKAPTVLQDIYHSTLGGILSRPRVLSFNKNDNFLLRATDIDVHPSACLLKGLFFPSSSRYQWMLYAAKPLRFKCWLHQYQWLLQLFMSKRAHWKWRALRRCDPYVILSSHWVLRKWLFTLLVMVYTFSYIYPIYDKIMYRRKHSRKH